MEAGCLIGKHKPLGHLLTSYGGNRTSTEHVVGGSSPS